MTALNTVGRIAGLDSDEYPRPQASRTADVIALAPATIRTLSILLTPSRAARVALFEQRTGMKIEAAIDAFLDDVLFDRGRE